jgi:molybdate transport system ATP-binding protein
VRGTTVILGPSGHGKTTILNMIAGIALPDNGTVSVDGRMLFDSRNRFSVAMEQRNIGYVFQDFLLFPHLSVFNNVAYGLRAKRLAATVVSRRVEAELERFHIGELRDAFPARLSAGQRQRVALARTLVLNPTALLLDEPLAALDVQLRNRVRGELRGIFREFDIPVVLVTHDPQDAMYLADQIMVIEHGRIVQGGDYDSLLARPSSRFVAEFIGANAFIGKVKGYDGTGLAEIQLAEGTSIYAPYVDQDPNVLVVIHPWEVAILDSDEAGATRNVFRGHILSICHLADRARLAIDIGLPITAEISRASLKHLSPQEGRPVFVGIKAMATQVLPLNGDAHSTADGMSAAGLTTDNRIHEPISLMGAS